MPKNMEIKAKLGTQTRFEETKLLALNLCPDQKMLVSLVQTDYFYESEKGRLNLRIFGDDSVGNLISYERPDVTVKGVKPSEYAIYPTTNAPLLKAVLDQSLKQTKIVKKNRFIYIFKQTRIHLDEVKDLGYFLELEFVMKPNQSENDASIEMEHIMSKLNITKADLLTGAYADMLPLPGLVS
jgi:predicted adenylyl cyclase CyaB